MSFFTTAHAAVILFFAVSSIGCAAEHLEARHPDRGPTYRDAPTTPVVRPTALRATDKQLSASSPGSSEESSMPMPTSDGSTHEHDSDGGMYRCPMHPDVRSSSPGTCPKCGMTLQKLGHSP